MYCKVFILMAIILEATSAPAPGDDASAYVIQYENTNDGNGNYKFSYETSQGIRREETGELVNTGQDDEHIVVRGEYSYIDSDGKIQVVRYVADENGYQVLPNNIQMPSSGGIGIFALPNAAIASLLG